MKKKINKILEFIGHFLIYFSCYFNKPSFCAYLIKISILKKKFFKKKLKNKKISIVLDRAIGHRDVEIIQETGSKAPEFLFMRRSITKIILFFFIDNKKIFFNYVKPPVNEKDYYNQSDISRKKHEEFWTEVIFSLKENYKKGLQPKDILASITNLFRNIFYIKYLPNDENIFNLTQNELKLVNQLNESITAKQLARILDLLDDINQNIKNAPSQELKLELFVVKLIKPEFAFDIKSLSRRVDLLEDGQPIVEINKPLIEKTNNEEDKKPKTKENKSDKKEVKSKNSIENFDVIWPIILKDAKNHLTPRKYSYLTLVKPEIENKELIFLIDESNEFLIAELNKSQDIKEFVEVEIEKHLGLNERIQIKAQEGLIKETKESSNFQENLENIFGIKSID